MGVLVDTTTNSWAPSPPKKKWMMHYLEEFPSTEDKASPVVVPVPISSSPCYPNSTVLTSSSSLPSSPPPLIAHSMMMPVPSPPLVNSSTTTSSNTQHHVTNHISFTSSSTTTAGGGAVVGMNGHALLAHEAAHQHLQHHQIISYVNSSSTSVTGACSPSSFQEVNMNTIGVVHAYTNHHHHNQNQQHAAVAQADSIKRRAGMSGIREVHNKLEKNRRAHLKECFEILKRQVPPSQEEKKSSNLSILHSAIRYIQFLRRREREFEHEMERLAREKISAQQRLSNLKKELSARWEHIDFNTLIPDNMQVDLPYDTYTRSETFPKERGGGGSGFLDEDGLMLMGSEPGDVMNGSSTSTSLKCNEDILYSSNSSLSGTMSPLQTYSIPVSTTPSACHKSHTQGLCSSPSAPVPIQFISSTNLRMLTSASAEQGQPLAFAAHSNGVARSRQDSSPLSSLSSASASSPPSSSVIVPPDSPSPSSSSSSCSPFIKLVHSHPTTGTTSLPPAAARSLQTSTAATAATPPTTSSILNGVLNPNVNVSHHNNNTLAAVNFRPTLIKTDNGVGSSTKLVSLNHLASGFVPAGPNNQVLLTTAPSHTSKILPPQLVKPLPSLQPISSSSSPAAPSHVVIPSTVSSQAHPHHIILKQNPAGVVMVTAPQLCHQNGANLRMQK